MENKWLLQAVGFTVGFTLLVVALAPTPLGAAEFTSYPGKNMPGLDIGSLDTLHVGTEQDEQRLCQRYCDLDPRCMAFTWVRRGIQPPATGSRPTAKCWFKAAARILDDGGVGLMVDDCNTFTGVKVYRSTPCWARHFLNLKFCKVVFAGSNGPPGSQVEALQCPPGSRQASHGNSRFCVVRLAHDPGGLPNCTDAFGGEAGEAGVLGNQVNHACLDAE